MTISSETGTVNGSDVTYNIPGRGSARGEGVIAYIDYTLAGSDALILTMSFQNTEINSDDYFKQIVVDTGILELASISVTATGLYRLPIATALNEESVILTFSDLDTGVVNVEFSVDNGFV